MDNDIEKLQAAYSTAKDKDKAYEELLAKYEEAQNRIKELEEKLVQNSNKLPTKEEVDTVSSMIDLLNKLDESTIEKLNKFGENKK